MFEHVSCLTGTSVAFRYCRRVNVRSCHIIYECDWKCAYVFGIRYELIRFFTWIRMAFHFVWSFSSLFAIFMLFYPRNSELETQANFVLPLCSSDVSPLFWLFFMSNRWKSCGSHSQNIYCIACLRKKNFERNLRYYYLNQINPPSTNKRNENMKELNFCLFRSFSFFFAWFRII